MRCVCLTLVSFLCVAVLHAADDAPRSLDPRLKIELFAEQPLIATPTGLDVDSRGRVWAIECNTHFRPENYPGHPSDRILIFNGKDPAKPPTVFADGFKSTMSVAVRPVWMPPIELPGLQIEARYKPDLIQQVLVAERHRIWLLIDLNGDDRADLREVLFELDTKGDYPHNGFAGFAFDATGMMYFGMGENLGEPYKILNHAGEVVYESDEGGKIFQCRPNGTGLRLWASGFWNPHSSCFDAFGRMFSVDNDPDSRPPCRLLHIIEGGDYGYHFKNGRKGLHPFTSWNGELPGTLPMVSGTGEAPSGVLAYEHDAFPAEYRGHLMATSWGDHRIDVFRLKPKGLSFESVAEPFIVGGENFRPVGLALAPDGSLYCTDWVLRDYKLHGKGRIWRISAVEGPSKSPDFAGLQKEERPGVLKQSLESPIGAVRRVAARRIGELNGLQNVGVVRDPAASERARYEALAAIVVGKTADEPRQLRDIFGPKDPPFDSTFTLMSHFGEKPSLQRVQSLLKDLNGSDPMYVLGGMKAFVPVLLAAAGSAPPKIIELLNSATGQMDAFALAALSRECARGLPEETLLKLVKSEAPLASNLRLAVLLAAKTVNPGNEQAMAAGIARRDLICRRAAVQWAAEQRVTSLRPSIEKCLSETPMDRDLFLSVIAALEMLDGKDPKDFDKTPAGKYVAPLLKDEKAHPAVLVEALRLVDPNDELVSVELLNHLIHHANEAVHWEAIRALAFRTKPDAIEPLMALASKQSGHQQDALGGVIRHYVAAPTNQRLRDFLLDLLPGSPLAATAFRGGFGHDAIVIERLDQYFRKAATFVPGFSGTPDVVDLDQQWRLTFGPDRIFPQTNFPVTKQPNAIDWRESGRLRTIQSQGSPYLGRFDFFHPAGPGCYRCHTIDGRGGKVGPDLSKIGATFTREKLVDSILDPSKEVSPQFTNWKMVHVDGRVFTGMIVHENEGKTILGDSDGKTIELKTAEIEERQPVKTSVMPEKLVERMTVQEWRDLLAFLQSTGK